jgi:hypothetical protein
VTAGPYGVGRHPMYAGAAHHPIGLPLLLGSWYGPAIAPLLIAGLSTRIGIEERMPRREFPDDADHAARVRHRLIPYVVKPSPNGLTDGCQVPLLATTATRPSLMSEAARSSIDRGTANTGTMTSGNAVISSFGASNESI